MKMLEQPPQSLDLNPIENLWFYIKRDIKRSQPKDLDQLFIAIEQSWNSIPRSLIKNLINFTPNGCQPVIKNFRYSTKY